MKEIFGQIIEILKKHNLDYKVLEHEKVISAQDAAKVRGTNINEAAKAIVLQAKTGEIVMCVVPGDKRIDLNKLKKMLGFKKMALANPEVVLKATNCTVGSVPPFGNLLFNMPMYADALFKEKEYVVFSAGSHYKSIKMKAADYLAVVNAPFLNFVK
jgi:Ala-tRNA(Pro) deacylase